MYVLRLIQILFALVQVERSLDRRYQPATLAPAMNKALQLVGNLRLNETINIQAELIELTQLVEALQTDVGYHINAGSLANVHSLCDNYADEDAVFLECGIMDFAKVFEVTENHQGTELTFLIGAKLKT